MNAKRILLVTMVALGGLALFGLIQGMIERATPAAPAATPKTAAQVAQEAEDEHYSAAIFACEVWAGKNAPGIKHVDLFGVPDDVIETFTVARTKPHLPGRYRVGFRYRSAGIGLLMRADCTAAQFGDKMLVLEAKAGPGS